MWFVVGLSRRSVGTARRIELGFGVEASFDLSQHSVIRIFYFCNLLQLKLSYRNGIFLLQLSEHG